MPDLYLWTKALHIIAVISWMAGLLYLPRLFVYHSATQNSEQSQTFKIMERRLLKVIMTPAMIVTWLTGLTLIFAFSAGHGGWFAVKFLFVIAMSAFHGFLARSTRQFANDSNTKSGKFWRIANEVPTIIMILIVVLAVVKPF